MLAAAEASGAEALVLCDTNGGTLPDDVERDRARRSTRETDAQIGIHCHNDAGCAVANSLAAVRAGATHVQGCVNGYGERAGNADLSAAIPNLSLKLQRPDDRPPTASSASRRSPTTSPSWSTWRPTPSSPTSARRSSPTRAACTRAPWPAGATSTSTSPPSWSATGPGVVVSEMAGRSTLAMKAAELGLELDGEVLGRVLDELKRLEHEGYHFEVADGSLELLLRRAGGWEPGFFEVESYRVITDHRARRRRRPAPGG